MFFSLKLVNDMIYFTDKTYRPKYLSPSMRVCHVEASCEDKSVVSLKDFR